MQQLVNGLLRPWREWTARWNEGRRWGMHPPAKEVRVFYGHGRIPSPDEKAFGGIVKCQDLETLFPNTPRGASVLYLVSSALPAQACVMAEEAKKHGVKVALNQDGVAYEGWHGRGWEKTNEPMKCLVHLADHVFFQSAFSKNSADLFLGQRNGPCEVLYNPVDTDVFKRAATDPAPGKTVLLLSGSHWAQYRVAVAVETLAHVLQKGLQAELVIAGRFCWRKKEDEARGEIERQMRELGVAEHVRVIGTYPQSQAVALMQSAHILLHTKYNDPCPRLVVEAMACGLPVVYSATGGTPELVGDQAGVGVESPLDWKCDRPPDPQRLAEGVMRVAENRSAFSTAARDRAVSRFDVRPWLKRHKDVFEEWVCPK